MTAEYVNHATNSALSGNLALSNMPADIVPGRLLWCLCAYDTAETPTLTGWTSIGGEGGNGGAQKLRLWVRKATGSDSGTITGASKARIAVVAQYTKWSGTETDVKVTWGSSNTVNPPNHSPGQGSLAFCWVALLRNNSSSTTTSPSGFDPIRQYNWLSTVWMSFADDQQTASSLDPGAFNGTASSAVVGTMSIPPGTSGEASGTSGAMMQYFMGHHPDELATRRLPEPGWKQRASGIYCRDRLALAA